jgi:hypothetical protein
LILFQLGKQSSLLVYKGLAGFHYNFFLCLQAAICTDVKKLVTVLYQNATHKQTAMAVGRVFFSAQKGDTKLAHTAFEPFDPRRKHPVSLHPAVEGTSSFVVISGVRWTAT